MTEMPDSPPRLDELVSAFVDDEATADQIASVESDPDFLARAEEFRTVRGALADAPAPPPAELRDIHIHAAADAADWLDSPVPVRPVRPPLRAAIRWRGHDLRPRRRTLLAAAAALVLVAAAVVAGINADQLGRGGGRSTEFETAAPLPQAAADADAADSLAAAEEAEEPAEPAKPAESPVGSVPQKAPPVDPAATEAEAVFAEDGVMAVDLGSLRDVDALLAVLAERSALSDDPSRAFPQDASDPQDASEEAVSSDVLVSPGPCAEPLAEHARRSGFSITAAFAAIIQGASERAVDVLLAHDHDGRLLALRAAAPACDIAVAFLPDADPAPRLPAQG